MAEQTSACSQCESSLPTAGLCIFFSFIFISGGIVLITLSCELIIAVLITGTDPFSPTLHSLDTGQVAAGQADGYSSRDRLYSAESPLAVWLALEPVEQNLWLQLCSVCCLCLGSLPRLHGNCRGTHIWSQRTLRLHPLLRELHFPRERALSV